MAGNFDRKLRLPRIHFRVLLHAANMRHGTNGFTSFPKEGVLRIFSPWKIRRLRPGLNPRTCGTKGHHATSRPLKLFHADYLAPCHPWFAHSCNRILDEDCKLWNHSLCSSLQATSVSFLVGACILLSTVFETSLAKVFPPVFSVLYKLTLCTLYALTRSAQ